MNLSKELKKKRDAENRLNQSSPQKIYIEGTGYIDLSKLALKDHKHTFLDLTDVPDDYIADKIVKVNSTGDALVFGDGGGAIEQATETTLGGIKAAAKTSAENSEVKIDIITGKLYSKATSSSGILVGTTAERPQVTQTDGYTVLLLHLDTDFSDSCGNASTANGNIQISTLQNKFGGASALFDGNGDFLTFQATNNFNLYGQKFTIDAWVYPIGSSNKHIFGYNNTTLNFWDIYINSSNKVVFRYNGNSGSLTTTGSITTGTWNHIAIVYDGLTTTIYINGVASGAVSSGILTANGAYVSSIGKNLYGGGYEYYFNGYMDEFRISKGIARWTGEFTPPNEAYFWESTGIGIGLPYFDTTLGKPIWSNGVNWIDATGTIV